MFSGFQSAKQPSYYILLAMCTSLIDYCKVCSQEHAQEKQDNKTPKRPIIKTYVQFCLPDISDSNTIKAARNTRILLIQSTVGSLGSTLWLSRVPVYGEGSAVPSFSCHHFLPPQTKTSREFCRITKKRGVQSSERLNCNSNFFMALNNESDDKWRGCQKRKEAGKEEWH